jgi:hypothetical protein
VSVHTDPDDPFADSVWAHADEAGIFHDEDGVEFRAVDVGGELTFQPLAPQS